MNARVTAPFAPLAEGLVDGEASALSTRVGLAHVVRATDEEIRVESPRRTFTGVALVVVALALGGVAHVLRQDPSTTLLAHGATLAAVPLLLLAFRALARRPAFVVTRGQVSVDAWPNPLARARVIAKSDVAAVHVRLVFERYKDVMRVVSARLLVVDRAGNAHTGPATETHPVDQWQAARDAVAPLARTIATWFRVPLVVDHTGPLPPALRDAESTAIADADDDASTDEDDDD